MIQRSYEDVSLWKYYSDPCSDKYEPRTDEVKLTDQGRRVYGGGGITPDVRIAETKLNEFQVTLWRSYSLQTFAQEYTLQHPKLEPNWEPTDAVLEEFRQFLYREKVEFSEADFSENADYVKRTLKREVYVSAYDLHEGEYVKHTLDPDVQKALDLLPEAKELLESSGRLIARQ